MIRIKIDKNRLNEPVFKINYKELEEKERLFLRRILMESKEIKGMFKYQVPVKFLVPILNNFNKENIILDRHSKTSFFEYSDKYDEKYYYTFEITPKYMKKWREEECPNIFKIEIDRETLELSKEIVFKKIQRSY